MLNLSDDAQGSPRGRKSVFSDTVSNPDLDELYFNKQHKGPGPAGPAIALHGFAFNIGPPTPAANLRL